MKKIICRTRSIKMVKVLSETALQLVSCLCIYGMAGVAGGMDRELIDPLPGLAGALFLLLTAVACWQTAKYVKGGKPHEHAKGKGSSRAKAA